MTEFESLSGADVVGQKSFSSNVLSLAPCYGLCLQGLKKAHLKTDLLPQEIKTERIIRAKKPWVLASVGALMLGLLLGYFFKQNATHAVSDNYQADNITWKQAKEKVSAQKRISDGLIAEDGKLKKRLEDLNTISAELTSATEDKATWMEIMKALHESLPVDERLAAVEFVDPAEIPFEDRNQIYIDHMETKFFENLSVWTTEIKPIYDNQFSKTFAAEDVGQFRELEELDEAAHETIAQTDEELVATGGWVIELKCHHYHNGEKNFNKGDWGRYYVIRTMVEKLISGTVEFPGESNEFEGGGEYRFTDFGVSYPTLVQFSEDRTPEIIRFGPDGVVDEEKDVNRRSSNFDFDNDDRDDDSEAEGETIYRPMRYDFTIQMAWLPRSAKERFEAKEARLEGEKAAAEAAEATAAAESAAAGL